MARYNKSPFFCLTRCFASIFYSPMQLRIICHARLLHGIGVAFTVYFEFIIDDGKFCVKSKEVKLGRLHPAYAPSEHCGSNRLRIHKIKSGGR